MSGNYVADARVPVSELPQFVNDMLTDLERVLLQIFALDDVENSETYGKRCVSRVPASAGYNDRSGRVTVTYFIFAGDMLVMLFMVVLVVWVFWRSSDKTISESASIPLQDEQSDG